MVATRPQRTLEALLLAAACVACFAPTVFAAAPAAPAKPPALAPRAAALRFHRRGERLWESARRTANATALRAAAEQYAAAWGADPSLTVAFYDLAFACRVGALVGFSACPSRAAVQDVLHAELDAGGSSGVSQLVALSSLDAPSFRRVAEAWAAAFEGGDSPPPALPPLPALPRPHSGGVLRVAYVSGLLRHHPVGHHLGGLLRHRSNALAVAVFATAPSDGSAHRARYKLACASRGDGNDGAGNPSAEGGGCEFIQLPPDASAAAIASAVRAWGAHVAVYIDGYDAGHVMGAVALRLAPLTVSFFGFLGTLGMRGVVDAIVVDETVAPSGDALVRSGFSERLLLRHNTTFFAQDYASVHPELLSSEGSAPATRAPVSLCFFGQLFKVDAPLLRSWLLILLRTATAPACAAGEGGQEARGGGLEREGVEGVQEARVGADGVSRAAQLLPSSGPLLHLLGYPPVAPAGIVDGVRALAPSLVPVWRALLAAGACNCSAALAEGSTATADADTPPSAAALADALLARLRFEPLRGEAEHLLWKRGACGLGLDSPHYNGHTSTADLLAAGVPVLTLTPPGSGFAGRAAASLVAAAGAPRFFTSASTNGAYEDAAVAYMRAAEGFAQAGGVSHGAPHAPTADGLPAVPRGPDGAPWRPATDLSSPLFDTRAWVRTWEGLLLAAAEGEAAREAEAASVSTHV